MVVYKMVCVYSAQSVSGVQTQCVLSLCVCEQQAEQLGREDQQRLHRNRKLVLMVDLDQTLIHTTEQHCQRMSNKVTLKNLYTLTVTSEQCQFL